MFSSSTFVVPNTCAWELNELMRIKTQEEGTKENIIMKKFFGKEITRNRGLTNGSNLFFFLNIKCLHLSY